MAYYYKGDFIFDILAHVSTKNITKPPTEYI
jgi:hypothetical protein